VLPEIIDVDSLPDENWVCSDATWCYGDCECSTTQATYLAICAAPLASEESSGDSDMDIVEDHAAVAKGSWSTKTKFEDRVREMLKTVTIKDHGWTVTKLSRTFQEFTGCEEEWWITLGFDTAKQAFLAIPELLTKTQGRGWFFVRRNHESLCITKTKKGASTARAAAAAAAAASTESRSLELKWTSAAVRHRILLKSAGGERRSAKSTSTRRIPKKALSPAAAAAAARALGRGGGGGGGAPLPPQSAIAPKKPRRNQQEEQVLEPVRHIVIQAEAKQIRAAAVVDGRTNRETVRPTQVTPLKVRVVINAVFDRLGLLLGPSLAFNNLYDAVLEVLVEMKIDCAPSQLGKCAQRVAEQMLVKLRRMPVRAAWNGKRRTSQ